LGFQRAFSRSTPFEKPFGSCFTGQLEQGEKTNLKEGVFQREVVLKHPPLASQPKGEGSCFVSCFSLLEKRQPDENPSSLLKKGRFKTFGCFAREGAVEKAGKGQV
jgi:hypothetical protein